MVCGGKDVESAGVLNSQSLNAFLQATESFAPSRQLGAGASGALL